MKYGILCLLMSNIALAHNKPWVLDNVYFFQYIHEGREGCAVQAVKHNRTDFKNISHNGASALWCAVAYEMPDLTKELLALPGIDPNTSYGNESALDVALKKNNIPILQALLSAPGIKITTGDYQACKSIVKDALKKRARLLRHMPVHVYNNSAVRKPKPNLTYQEIISRVVSKDEQKEKGGKK